jgi:hypothetical protein
LTLLLISSGISEGAVESLKVGDLTPITDKEKTTDKEDSVVVAGRLLVYAGDREQYITFTSKEAFDAIQEYLSFRKEHGEDISKDSPLIRDKFDPIKGRYGHGKENAADAVIPMTAHAIRLYYNRLLYSIGIRKEHKRRHDFSVHGFRKYFKTKAEIAGVKPINVETLMGHSTGIGDSYYRLTETELPQEVTAATPRKANMDFFFFCCNVCFEDVSSSSSFLLRKSNSFFIPIDIGTIPSNAIIVGCTTSARNTPPKLIAIRNPIPRNCPITTCRTGTV